MHTMTIKFLNTQIQNLSDDMKEISGVETPLSLEQGNAYIAWKVCAGSRGSHTLITANSKRELSERIYAASAMIRHMKFAAKGE